MQSLLDGVGLGWVAGRSLEARLGEVRKGAIEWKAPWIVTGLQSGHEHFTEETIIYSWSKEQLSSVLFASLFVFSSSTFLSSFNPYCPLLPDMPVKSLCLIYSFQV